MSRVATPLAVETPPETPLEDSAANDECVVVSLKRERSLEREKETRKRRRIVTDRDTDSSPHARPPSRLGVAVVESVEVDVEISEPHAERAPSPTESLERASTPASSSPTVTVTATTDATPPRTATPTPTPPPRASTPTSTMPTSTLSASTPTSSTPPARSATRTPTSSSPQPPRASTPTASTPRSTYRQRASDMRLTIRPPIMIPGQESAARRSQITPPPSDRMLDHSNPPQPPRKVKKKRRLNSQYPGSGRRSTSPPVPLMVSPARVPIARLPRLSSESSSTRSGDASPLPSPASTSARSSLLMVAPPSRVFRSLEAEFDAVADEPPRPLRLHSPPALHRVTRMFPEPTSTTNSGPNGSAHSSPSVVRVKPRATRAPIVSISTASPSSTTTSAVAASVTKPEPVTGTAKTDNTVETTRQELSLKRKERPSDEDEA